MSEQLRLPLTTKRCPPSIAESMRQRYLTVMGELSSVYGVSALSLRVHGRWVELRGPRGGLHAQAGRPAHPMPPVSDPRWYSWCTQAALWAHRARGCRGCGKALQRARLDREGYCQSCRVERKRDRVQQRLGLVFSEALKAGTSLRQLVGVAA